MDETWELIASKCSEQMASFQNCVQINQNSNWTKICKPEADKLSQCSEIVVPLLKTIREGCAKEINGYKSCLDRMDRRPDDEIQKECGGLFNEMIWCSDKIKGKR